MQTAPAYHGPRPGQFLSRAEAWLDARGRAAWIAAMVIGLVFFWPVGLALAVYMTVAGKWSMGRAARGALGHGRATGNSAFDAYKDATLRRLEDEQRAFEEFLQRLREAKDKAEFDQFMDDRAKRGDTPAKDA